MKEIKINIPEGYEIDTEKSSLKEGNIVFKVKNREVHYIDLGLPSGTLWEDCNVDEYYTYNKVVKKFGNKLPTRAQFCELIDYAKHEWDKEKKGMWFIGENGNKLFIPALGYKRNSYRSAYLAGDYGCYWSSIFDDGNYAWCLRFDSSNVYTNNYRRDYGFPVRLVKDNFKK